ncbi:MAG: hypothetical protein AAFR59_01835, partial [Bacteroidota bacterium]
AGLVENTLIIEMDGQNALDIDVESYMNSKKEGDQINFRIYQEGEVKEVLVDYEARFTPFTYEVMTSEKAKSQQVDRREAWLKSVQK